MKCTLTTASGEPLYAKNDRNDNGGRAIVCEGPNAFKDCCHAARVRTNSKRNATQNYGPHVRVGGVLQYYVGDMHITCEPPLRDGAVHLLKPDGSHAPVEEAAALVASGD